MTIVCIFGRKRINSGEDVRPMKVAKVEMFKAAELPIGVGRNTDDKAEEAQSVDEMNKQYMVLEEDLKKPNECGQDTHAGDKLAAKKTSSDDELNKLCTRSGCKAEVACNDEVNKLRKMFKEDLKNLDEKVQDCMIHCMTVEEIVSLVLELGEGKGSDDDIEEESDFEEEEKRHMIDMIDCMIDYPEKLKKAEFCLLYKTLDYMHFASLALSALYFNQERLLFHKYNEIDSNSDLWLNDEDTTKFLKPLMPEQSDMIPALCRVLPYKLFDHIFSAMSGLHLFASSHEEPSEVCTGDE